MACHGTYAVGQQQPSALKLSFCTEKCALKSCLLIKKSYYFLRTYYVPGIVKVFTNIILFNSPNNSMR